MARSLSAVPKYQSQQTDLAEANRFLDVLGPNEEFEFQTFDDNPDRQLKNRKLAGTGHGTLATNADWLIRANQRHAAALVTLNRTDGLGRKKENITAVRGVTVDLDGAPIDPVRECVLKPQLIVETSPGRFHAIWRVDGLPLDSFTGVQLAIAKRFDGDPAVALLTHCERLPGFFNCKDIDNRFRVRIVDVHDAPPYTAEQITAEFPPETSPHKSSGSRIILPAGAPMAAAAEFLKRCHSVGDHSLLYAYRGVFYLWTGTHYREYDDEEIERDLYAFLNSALVQDGKGVLGPFKPNRNKVGEVVHVLRRGLLIPKDRQTPCWLGEKTDDPADDLIACRNGILNLRTRELLPHDPRFFCVNCLPLDYAPHTPTPERWFQFLTELWPDDESAELTLQEIFGYLLTSDNRQHKIFLIVGPARGGKGTITFALVELLGKDNVVFPTLKSMTGEFGRWPLIDKKLAVIADARLGPRADAHAVAEHLLGISGGDPQSINRKNQSFWHGYLGVRFLITTNELPAIEDASGTLPTRFVLLKLTQSFLGREDLTLKDKLRPELAAILNWALDGLDRLRRRGHFEMPASSKVELQILEDLASPVKAFVRERCETSPALFVVRKELWAAWRQWCEDEGHQAGNHIEFGRKLRAAFPSLKRSKRGGVRVYVGIALSDTGREWFERKAPGWGG